MWIAYFFASGAAYFVGAALTGVAACLPCSRPRFLRGIVTPVLAVAGVVCALLSATPTSTVLYVLWFGLTAVWLVLRFGRRPATPLPQDATAATASRGGQAAARTETGLRCAVAILSVVAVLTEWPHTRDPHLTRTGTRTLYVIGDSISAGVGGNSEHTWPALVARRHAIDVVNLAVAGATARSALAQASRAVDPAAAVLVEIGGNDLLGGTAVARFEQDLDALLAALTVPHRLVVMVELPLLPFNNGYGAAQRRVARAAGVALIPKRHLAGVVSATGATIDGLHLSDAGHDLMERAMWSVLRPAFED